ncbi:mucin-2-like isoform X2 [Carassius gibelio]|uniref:mucin-2-like isoform X2 n=1 Tax=Carassius gibelio TaxID=101364 RepID=UPI002279789F|nr:mucin-2-like isoform X2 [Carassius gibelio]
MEWRASTVSVLLLALTGIQVNSTMVYPSNHVNSICSMWGDFHFKTFDGDVYQFPGMCEYNLVSDCQSLIHQFSVHVKRTENSTGPKISRVLITINDIGVELTEKQVLVNEEKVKLPVQLAGILVEENTIYTRLYSKMGITVKWNKNDAVMVELDSKYSNRTCGLCGDFNGVPVYNEFIDSGRRIGYVEFGNKHRVRNPMHACEDPFENVDEKNVVNKCEKVQTDCADLLKDEKWSSCRWVLNPEPYIKACTNDICSRQTKDKDSKTSAICASLSEYSRLCSHAGGAPPNWRTAAFCAVTCPYNMVHSESGSPCMDTCSHQNTNSLCEEHNTDGCFCPPGTVFDDISNKGCIPSERCKCKHDHIYNTGEILHKDEGECVCEEGEWVCTSIPRPGLCSLEEGSHFTTFDGKEFTFNGDCHYVLSKDCNQTKFSILGEIAPCYTRQTDTCLKSVVVLFYNDLKIPLIIKADGSVQHNADILLPYITADFTVFMPSSFHVMLQTTFGLQVQIQLVPLMQVYITVDQSLQGKTCGLCGNFNKVLSDDLKTPQGVVEGTPVSFANSWKSSFNCPDRTERMDDPCSYSSDSENFAQHWCSKMQDKESLFAKCHTTVNPESYYKRCKYSSCSCEKSEDCLCAVVSSYVRACAAKGISLQGWRKIVCEKYTKNCPASQNYSYQLQTCQRTCLSLASERQSCSVDFVPVDGCACPDGLYQDENGLCVPSEKCPCFHTGQKINPGKSITVRDEHCICIKGKLHCHSWKNQTQVCSSPKVFFNCSTAAPDEYGLECAKTCSQQKVDCFSEHCQSGCQCPSGLLDDGIGHCVKPDNCPCKHNGQFYKQGSTITTDCNKCTCQGGKWKCTHYKCPGICTIYGSGHYRTFDQQRFGFSGGCSYIAAQNNCGNKTGNFYVITENMPCGTTGTTCSKAVKILLGRTMLLLSGGTVTATDTKSGPEIRYTERNFGMYLVIDANIGLTILWDRKTTVRIILQPQHMDNVCGLCGNFNGDAKDDFTTQGNLPTTNAMEFVDSWKVLSSCPDAKPDFNPCVETPNRENWAKIQCSIIKDIKGPFKACHNKVDQNPYYDNCVKDSCACDTGGDCECLCTAVAAYAQACNEADVCVNWRTPEICPVYCDYYNTGTDDCTWHYSPCHTSCYKTCLNPNATCDNNLPNLEGCYPKCPEDKPIFDEKNQICVAECIPTPTPTPSTSSFPPTTTTTKPTTTTTKPSTSSFPTPTTTTKPTTTTTKPSTSSFPTPTTTTKPTTTTPTKPTTTTPKPTTPSSPITTTITSTRSTTSCIICGWSEWFNVYNPDLEGGNDFETYKNIAERGKEICKEPIGVECRSVKNSNMSFDDFINKSKQVAQCNVSYGLECKRDQQKDRPFKCFDYEIRVYCCIPCSPTTTPTATTKSSTTTPKHTTPSSPTPTTTTKPPTTTPKPSTSSFPTPTTTTKHTTTTSKPTTPSSPITTTITFTSTSTKSTTSCSICGWSDWFNVYNPDLEGGNDLETYKNIAERGKEICKEPIGVECRSVKNSNMSFEDFINKSKQVAQCNVSYGLECKKDQQKDRPFKCFDYEIRVYCCIPCSPTTTLTATTKSTTTPKPTTPSSPTPTTTTKSSTTTPKLNTPSSPTPTTTTKSSTTTPKLNTPSSPTPTTTTKSTTTTPKPTKPSSPTPTTTTKSTTTISEPTTPSTPTSTTTTKSTTTPIHPTPSTPTPTATTKTTTTPKHTTPSSPTPTTTTKSTTTTEKPTTPSTRTTTPKPTILPSPTPTTTTKSTTTPKATTPSTPTSTATTESIATSKSTTSSSPTPTTTTKSTTTTPKHTTASSPTPTTTTKSTTTTPKHTTPSSPTPTATTTSPKPTTPSTPTSTASTKSTTTTPKPTTPSSPTPTTTTKSTTTTLKPTTPSTPITTQKPTTPSSPTPTITPKPTTPSSPTPTTTTKSTTTTPKPTTPSTPTPTATTKTTTTPKHTTPSSPTPTTTTKSTTTTEKPTTPSTRTTTPKPTTPSSPTPTTTPKPTTPSSPTPTTTTKSTTTTPKPTTLSTPTPTATTKTTTTPKHTTPSSPTPTTTTKYTTTPKATTPSTPTSTATTESIATTSKHTTASSPTPTTTTESTTTTPKHTTPSSPTPTATTTSPKPTTPSTPTSTASTKSTTTTPKPTTPSSPTPTTTTKSTSTTIPSSTAQTTKSITTQTATTPSIPTSTITIKSTTTTTPKPTTPSTPTSTATTKSTTTTPPTPKYTTSTFPTPTTTTKSTTTPKLTTPSSPTPIITTKTTSTTIPSSTAQITKSITTQTATTPSTPTSTITIKSTTRTTPKPTTSSTPTLTATTKSITTTPKSTTPSSPISTATTKSTSTTPKPTTPSTPTSTASTKSTTTTPKPTTPSTPTPTASTKSTTTPPTPKYTTPTFPTPTTTTKSTTTPKLTTQSSPTPTITTKTTSTTIPSSTAQTTKSITTQTATTPSIPTSTITIKSTTTTTPKPTTPSTPTSTATTKSTTTTPPTPKYTTPTFPTPTTTTKSTTTPKLTTPSSPTPTITTKTTSTTIPSSTAQTTKSFTTQTATTPSTPTSTITIKSTTTTTPKPTTSSTPTLTATTKSITTTPKSTTPSSPISTATTKSTSTTPKPTTPSTPTSTASTKSTTTTPKPTTPSSPTLTTTTKSTTTTPKPTTPSTLTTTPSSPTPTTTPKPTTPSSPTPTTTTKSTTGTPKPTTPSSPTPKATTKSTTTTPNPTTPSSPTPTTTTKSTTKTTSKITTPSTPTPTPTTKSTTGTPKPNTPSSPTPTAITKSTTTTPNPTTSSSPTPKATTKSTTTQNPTILPSPTPTTTTKSTTTTPKATTPSNHTSTATTKSTSTTSKPTMPSSPTPTATTTSPKPTTPSTPTPTASTKFTTTTPKPTTPSSPTPTTATKSTTTTPKPTTPSTPATTPKPTTPSSPTPKITTKSTPTTTTKTTTPTTPKHTPTTKSTTATTTSPKPTTPKSTTTTTPKPTTPSTPTSTATTKSTSTTPKPTTPSTPTPTASTKSTTTTPNPTTSSSPTPTATTTSTTTQKPTILPSPTPTTKSTTTTTKATTPSSPTSTSTTKSITTSKPTTPSSSTTSATTRSTTTTTPKPTTPSTPTLTATTKSTTTTSKPTIPSSPTPTSTIKSTITTPKPTTPSTPTTKPGHTTSTSSISTTTATPPDCPEWAKNTNETFYLCKCMMARCIKDNNIEVIPFQCPPLQNITCENGKKPVLVEDEYGCCKYYACDCFCEGWGDPHYKTFDGKFYSHQGNCTYTLMEEIRPQTHLKIYIDSVYCDLVERVSCPRSIIVSYNKLVIKLTNHNLLGGADLEAFENNVKLRLPYAYNGVRVVSSSLDLFLSIPLLGVNISFGATGFGINLPFQHFGNNTQGHCGTCNNNKADDCMIPGGILVDDCAVMADYWPASGVNGEVCTPPSALPSVPVKNKLPSKQCKAHPDCYLLNNELFKACHSHIPPQNFILSCQYDSCHMGNPAVVCISLQTYARACLQLGICINWRNYTKLCNIECPADKVFNPCGPAEPPTCADIPEQKNIKMRTEGCFCPEGTLLFNKNTKVCVNKCGCLDSSKIPRDFGEVFEYNCEECICEKNSKSVSCKPKACLDVSTEICTEPGFVLVNVTNPSDPCCSKQVCNCDVSMCPPMDKKCPIGHNPVVKVPDGKCCPEIKCEPKKVCVYKNMVYEPGTNIPKDGCQECRCTLDVDPKTQLFMTKCQSVKCIEKCDPGYENIKKKPDDCCGECVKTHCIVSINGVDHTLKEGETFPSTNQGCDRITCTKINGQFITNKYTVQCPPFNISNCQPGTVQLSSDGCCNVCVDQIKGCRVQTVRKYIQQKDCVSEKKMDLTFCSGDCSSFGRYSEPELSSCTCCQATQTSNRTVTLGCVNGDIITHTYVNAEKCACSKANCHREDVGKTLTEDKK